MQEATDAAAAGQDKRFERLEFLLALVDEALDGQVGTPSTIQRSLFAKLLTPLRRPRAPVGDPDHASAQAWIGLSFTDNGTDYYTGLHPGSPFSPFVAAAKPLSDYAFEAASDPV